ncbi:hypothetical protein ONO23_05502 [Micromonospora noduli]|uniref:hypothetical protein n=1 Tax=Micromonospora noduli TaxID=709876 RepID=UPI000DBF9422|nr:hypothetical protein [Micromonospora noduli]RAO26099.1 hypothetical protein ONO23_05502 [Micromonospora noduli]
MKTKRYRELLSCEQLVTSTGAWDRVHGVNHMDTAPGKVLVTTESQRRVEHDADAIVQVV